MIGDILQPTHLIFVLVVALLVLGPKRLPEVGRSLGKGLRDFRSAMSGEDHEAVDSAPIQTHVDSGQTASAPVEYTEPVEHGEPVVHGEPLVHSTPAEQSAPVEHSS